MSNRTIIEINHDFSGEIRNVPELFMMALDGYLRNADQTGQDAEALRVMFGATVLTTRHHSDPVLDQVARVAKGTS